MNNPKSYSSEQIDLPTLSEEGVEFPFYASLGAAGADIRANILENVLLEPGTSVLIPTGLRFEIPLGYEIQVRPRSGLALKHGVTVLNSPGTVDSDYRGELKVILINHGLKTFIIEPGMRIAQIVFTQVIQANFISVQELASTERGAGGFGHSGLN